MFPTALDKGSRWSHTLPDLAQPICVTLSAVVDHICWQPVVVIRARVAQRAEPSRLNDRQKKIQIMKIKRTKPNMHHHKKTNLSRHR